MKLAGAVAAALVALTFAMTWPLAAVWSSSVPGDYGDPLLAAWAMGWVSRMFASAFADPTALAGFWNANIFYPEAQTLACSEHFIGQSLLAGPVYAMTGNLILAYNTVFLATFVLSGLGTFLLTRALVDSAGAASGSPVPAVLAGIAAGVVMAFNQYRLAYEVAHLHVLSIHWLPFALLGLHCYVATDSRWALGGGVLALVGLNLSSIYYMAYCAPFVVAFVVLEAVRLGRWRTVRLWFELWAAAAVVAVIMLPFVLPYIEVQRRLGVVRQPAELVAYSATLDHYRLALPGLIVPFVLAVMALAARPAWRRSVLTYGLITLLATSVWLSLGPVVQFAGQHLEWPSLYPLLHGSVPGYTALKAPARFAMLFVFFLALLAGIGASRLAVWSPRLARPVLAVLLSAYLWQTRPAALPLDRPLPSPDLAAAPAYLTPSARLPSIYRDVKALGSDAVLIELPFGDPWYELRYMFFAATHGKRLVNGYSGVFPPSYLARQRVLAKPWLDPRPAATALAGATHVIVHRGAWRDDTGTKLAIWLEQLGAHIVSTAGDALLLELRSSERLADRTDAPNRP